MSGTSLDGLDLALCEIDGTRYRIVDATTVAYSNQWRQRLASLDSGSAFELALAHADLGHLFGRLAHEFLAGRPCQAIASHGHTIFHQPDRGLTLQIGDPDAIAAECRLPVVSGFRTLDVALGGQGAPLVPIGDQLFFSQYDACLNLGGIANISYGRHRRIAFDICPCNMALNRLAGEMGLDYDADGQLARQGVNDCHLTRSLEMLDYYRLPAPKTLGKEWFVNHFWPVVEASGLATVDKLRTINDHIASRIADALNKGNVRSVLITGGGAHNSFLIETLRAWSPQIQVEVPDPLTVDYKEALVFALLGYLRLNGKANTLCSVTGARADSVGGSLSGWEFRPDNQ